MEGLAIFAIIGVPALLWIIASAYKSEKEAAYRKERDKLYAEYRKKEEALYSEKKRLNEEVEAIKEKYNNELDSLNVEYNDRLVALDEEYDEKFDILKEDKIAFDKIVEEKTKGFPWLADRLSLYHTAYLSSLESHLRNKANPAIKGAEAVKEAKERAREYERKYRLAQGLLDYYESVVPWLPELQDAPDEAIIKRNGISGDTKEDRAREFLTSGEWEALSTQAKFQRALDRYWSQDKSKWEIGRLYERFVGYEYEVQGWDITYFGAIKGYEDLGRDLIAKKDNQILIIQCKNWAAEKVIHEKHIFQLYGTCILYELQNKKAGEELKGVFVSACPLSDMAKECAARLGIEVVEGKKLERFPCIKCVSRGKEPIYHLPFDQQYDRIKMQLAKGDSYCATIEEAEEKGFRRAYRWHGNS